MTKKIRLFYWQPATGLPMLPASKDLRVGSGQRSAFPGQLLGLVRAQGQPLGERIQEKGHLGSTNGQGLPPSGTSMIFHDLPCTSQLCILCSLWSCCASSQDAEMIFLIAYACFRSWSSSMPPVVAGSGLCFYLVRSTYVATSSSLSVIEL